VACASRGTGMKRESRADPRRKSAAATAAAFSIYFVTF
jgi:hypothetical protein